MYPKIAVYTKQVMDRLRFLNLKASPTERSAELLSFITNPAIVLFVGLIVITKHYSTSIEQFLHWLGWGTLLLVVPSALYIAYTWKKEHKIDIDVALRRDRIVPMMMTTLGALIGSHLIEDRLNNPNLILIANILAVMLVVLTIVTLAWKISLHAATMATGVSMLVIFAGPIYVWLYLLLYPLGWARVTLKQHTTAQVIAGSIVGVVVTFLASSLFHN